YTQFFWTTILDNLIVNIAAAVITYDCFTEVESILFENLLQEDIWTVFLAVEVWTLLLCNSTPHVCLETLSNLIRKHQDADFGLHTNRFEQIHMKCLMQRIFKMLPGYMKIEIIQTFNPLKNIHTWKILEFKHFPAQQRLSIEGISRVTVDKIESFEIGNCSLKDLTFVAENMDVLATANFNELGLNFTKLVNAVHSLWEFNTNYNGLISNNFFKYFISKLCKITSNLIEEFDDKQIITVLTHLKEFSTDDFYRLLVCDVLLVVSKKKSDFNQEKHKITILITNIIYPNLYTTKNSVIKQNVLEVIHNLAISGKYDIVRDIMRISNEMQGEISNYLQRNISSNKLNKEYLTLLGTFQFRHECIKWKTDVTQPRSKKPKIEETVFSNESRDVKTQTNEKVETIKIAPKIETLKPVEDKTEDISEVIDSIKGEVKCLINVLKTEKLSRKNASDIKLIANQLLSFL
ncbi:hypothetical protein NQ314_006366, partial [Rhamnusium bicolor]